MNTRPILTSRRDTNTLRRVSQPSQLPNYASVSRRPISLSGSTHIDRYTHANIRIYVNTVWHAHMWAYLDRHMYIETFRSTHLDRHILRNTETLLSPVTAPQDVINMSPRCRASAELLIRRHTLLHRVKKCAQIIASLNNSRYIRFHDSLFIIVQEFTVYKLPCSMPSAASFHTHTQRCTLQG